MSLCRDVGLAEARSTTLIVILSAAKEPALSLSKGLQSTRNAIETRCRVPHIPRLRCGRRRTTRTRNVQRFN
jgi:hypothetical protein